MCESNFHKSHNYRCTKNEAKLTCRNVIETTRHHTEKWRIIHIMYQECRNDRNNSTKYTEWPHNDDLTHDARLLWPHACMCVVCMCVEGHTHIHAYMHTYMHTCIHTCIHACMHACIHRYMRTHMHRCTCRHTLALRARERVRVRVREREIYIYIYICYNTRRTCCSSAVSRRRPASWWGPAWTRRHTIPYTI